MSLGLASWLVGCGCACMMFCPGVAKPPLNLFEGGCLPPPSLPRPDAGGSDAGVKLLSALFFPEPLSGGLLSLGAQERGGGAAGVV